MKMIRMETTPFVPNEHCRLVAQDDDVRVFWVETSKCVWFIDIETGFKINHSARLFDTPGAAEDWAKKELRIDA